MKRRLARPMLGLAIASLILVQFMTSGTPAGAFGYSHLTKLQHRLLSGLADFELNPANAPSMLPAARQNSASAVALTSNNSGASNYYPNRAGDCPAAIGSNIKVNQNCLNLTDANLAGRGQANNETSIAYDPSNPDHLIASANDYRRGDGNCYTSYSLDRGKTWKDSTVPMSFVNGQLFGFAREYWQAGGDTSVAWDTKGNAYLSCQVFNRGTPLSPNPDASSAMLIFRSTQNSGASWNFTAHIVTAFADTAGTIGALEDKQLMTVDNHVGSPFQDRVYVTWTEFLDDGTAYIWESYSADYGQTFSPRVLVSKNSQLCPNSFGLPTPLGSCNANQFSQPFTGPDGALYVVWANFNNGVGKPIGDPDAGGGDVNNANAKAAANPNENFNQMLLVKSTDGGATFSAPVLVGTYYDLPDCATYQNGQDPGRACVPEKGPTSNSVFRATNYPVGAVNPRNPQQVVISYGSYINRFSNEHNGCAPAGFSDFGLNLYTGVKTSGACNNDILLSVSLNGGKRFTGANTDPREMISANPAPRQRVADQWWQWATFTNEGDFAVSYYDRQYGNAEWTGFSDFSLTTSSNGDMNGRATSSDHDNGHFGIQRATSSSMPPPTQFAGTFFGDYTGMAAVNRTAYPLWMDTRIPALFLCPGTGAPGVPPAVCTASAANAALANDQELFVAALRIP